MRRPEALQIARRGRAVRLLSRQSSIQRCDSDPAAPPATRRTQDREPSVWATLAAAYAETGDFTRAAETARKAAQLAEDTQQGEIASVIRDQLDGYLKNQPYRDPRT